MLLRVGLVIDEFEGVLAGGIGGCCLMGFDEDSSTEEDIFDAEAPEIAELVLEAEIPLARPCRLGGGSGGRGCFGLDGGRPTELACNSSDRFTKSEVGRSWVTTRGLSLVGEEYRETSGKGGSEFDKLAWFDDILSRTLTSADVPLSSEGSAFDLEAIGGGGKGLLRLTGELGVDDEVGSTGLVVEPEGEYGRSWKRAVFWEVRSDVSS